MPVIKGTQSITPIYKGTDKIGKIFKGLDLVYQSFVYNPTIALIERTIENVDVELTNEITKIGTYAFGSCTSLKNINIPNSVTTIEAYAFYGCTSLNNLIIPSSVTTINSSFDNCDSLTTMTFLSTVPPELSSSGAIPKATTTIYVPLESVDSYKNASNWRELTTRTENPVTFVGI